MIFLWKKHALILFLAIDLTTDEDSKEEFEVTFFSFFAS